ncbi:MAG: Holliday junction resolvase RuvX [Bacilli bacterium]|nr:Holliday junction resolvase RuvX [Bacilli bacterium]
MRYLGLDLGTKTLGVAITDRSGILSSPLKTIRFPFENYNEAAKLLKEIIDEYNIKTVALGLPLNMDGSKGFASERSLNFKKILEDEFGLEVELIDERLTSIQAHSILSDNGKKEIEHKKNVDAVAATLILETYLKKKGM